MGLMGKFAFSTSLDPVYQPGLWDHRLSLSGWVANFNHRAAMRSLKNDSQHLNEVSIFGVGATMGGELAPETDFIEAALAVTKRLNPQQKILLTVANIRPHRVQDRWLLRRWLGTEEKRAKHIQDLMSLAAPFDGLDIDYENLTPIDARCFERFLVVLGQALHAQGKILTVTVEHETLMSGMIHWNRVDSAVDRVRVMAYQYHYERTSPGSVAPPWRVRRLVQRALVEIPSRKLEIALPMYGYDWSSTGITTTVPTLGQFRRLTRKPRARVFRTSRTHAARIDYDVTNVKNGRSQRVHHEVWFEDPESVAYKVRMLQELGISHIGFWQLGAGGISELFNLVRGPENTQKNEVRQTSFKSID